MRPSRRWQDSIRHELSGVDAGILWQHGRGPGGLLPFRPLSALKNDYGRHGQRMLDARS